MWSDFFSLHLLQRLGAATFRRCVSQFNTGSFKSVVMIDLSCLVSKHILLPRDVFFSKISSFAITDKHMHLNWHRRWRCFALEAANNCANVGLAPRHEGKVVNL